jgi:hypothetical protein
VSAVQNDEQQSQNGDHCGEEPRGGYSPAPGRARPVAEKSRQGTPERRSRTGFLH